MNDASSALAGVATDMRACQTKILSQKMDQKGPVLDVARNRRLIHRKPDSRHTRPPTMSFVFFICLIRSLRPRLCNTHFRKAPSYLRRSVRGCFRFGGDIVATAVACPSSTIAEPARENLDIWYLSQLRYCAGQPTPPVGMSIDRPRHVDLFAYAQQILDRQRHNSRRCRAH